VEDPAIPQIVPIWLGAFLAAMLLAAAVQNDWTGWVAIAVFAAAPAWASWRLARAGWRSPGGRIAVVLIPLLLAGVWVSLTRIHSTVTGAALSHSVGGDGCRRAGGEWRCDVLGSGEDSGSVTYRVAVHGSCWTGSPLTARTGSPRIHGCVVLLDRVASF
jgi:hypothetical protein